MPQHRRQQPVEEPTVEGRPNNETLKLIFRARTLKLLDEKGWNQTDLGRRAGIGRDLISTYLRPNPRSLPEPANMLKIADALGVKTSELLPSMGDMLPVSTAPMEVVGQDASGFRIKLNIPLPFWAFGELTALIQRVIAEGGGADLSPQER